MASNANFLDKKILCIIPARSGSVRIKDKNLSIISGKTLVRHAFDAAQESGIFTDIVISSDQERMADGLPWVKRPAEISESGSDISEALKHALIEMEKRNFYKYEYIVCLQPALPLRNSLLIKKLVQNVVKNDCNGGLTGVKTVPWLWHAKKNHAFNSWHPKPYPRSQEFEQINLWQEVNTVQVCSREFCLNGFRWGLPLYILFLPTYATLDIDDLDDLDRAKKVYSYLLDAINKETFDDGIIVKKIN